MDLGLIATILALILFFVLGQYKDIYKFFKRIFEYVYGYLYYKKMSEITYFKYKKRPHNFNNWEIITDFLESRYKTNAFLFCGYKLPVALIWENTNKEIPPDSVLGFLNKSEPEIFADKSHREFIKKMEENPESPYKHESINYRLTNISMDSELPKINGALGKYYDNVLTQYGMEWELNKIIIKSKSKEKLLKKINKYGSLPLREKIELNTSSPMTVGSSRCASLTISTFFVFKKSTGYCCLVKKRSNKVGVSPNMFHVVPAGMFESTHNDYENEWSIRYNILREFIEEVYNIPEVISSNPSNSEHMYKIEPLPYLLKLFEEGKAHLSITGISVDLLGLRTEINTILFVDDEDFVKQKKMDINWEYVHKQSEEINAGDFALKIIDLDKFINDNINASNIVGSGAVTLELGRRWLKNIYNIC